MSKVSSFMTEAKNLHEIAVQCGDDVYGFRPWYCSIRRISPTTKIALVASHPTGNRDDEERDVKSGVLEAPFDDESSYQAWLDDIHWAAIEGYAPEQLMVQEFFKILFGDRWEEALRGTASFNVVPSRSLSAANLTDRTWNAGIALCYDILRYISPGVIVCLGNDGEKSPWSALERQWPQEYSPTKELRLVSSVNHSLKVRKSGSKNFNAIVLGLPRMSRFTSADAASLRNAAEGLGITNMFSN